MASLTARPVLPTVGVLSPRKKISPPNLKTTWEHLPSVRATCPYPRNWNLRKKIFFLASRSQGAEALVKGGRLPARVAHSAPSPISPEKNFFAQGESGGRGPSQGWETASQRCPGLPPSPISPSKKLQRWRHLLQEHLFFLIFPIGEQVTKASSITGSRH